MNNLYFSKCLIERSANMQNGEYKVDLQKNIEEKGNHEFDVELTLTVKKDDFSLLIIAKADLKYYKEAGAKCKDSTIYGCKFHCNHTICCVYLRFCNSPFCSNLSILHNLYILYHHRLPRLLA